ncbi:hypothetical protein P3342_006165 [Pyrenophora teres f. teres]|uniref:Uncharacterized protein n=1 Tax=Pyrenophora teres f. teres TaxID=97479 RepID=A0A6S6W0N6_9PLEO|nr:hypothetical protein HRS9139_00025 [Pyrenophora teres f. teres]KAE8847593.1 hypothetical protein PTNB85_01436 [Pyrenophora teres f. teres]KAE8854248.1 hypothetical protein HRS9122_01240 [Pyrenophora teres f. teres]KAE8867522.1 hypothetical protein PTNB29_01433 [Pyrenophora teres f. teres]KAE8872291.1 hypothetical protein PTNB73_01442 [Pyrenophora teres f. teres]
MRNFLPLTLILLIPAARAWDACHCTGENTDFNRQITSYCCETGNGVSFPNYPSDVKGSWDGNFCKFSGTILSITQNDAMNGFAQCCKNSGHKPIWGGKCCTRKPFGKCT